MIDACAFSRHGAVYLFVLVLITQKQPNKTNNATVRHKTVRIDR